MIAHSTCAVYAVCNVQVLGKKSHAKQRVEHDEGGGLEPVRKVRDEAVHVEDRIICMAHGLMRTLDIPCPEALK